MEISEPSDRLMRVLILGTLQEGPSKYTGICPVLYTNILVTPSYISRKT